MESKQLYLLLLMVFIGCIHVESRILNGLGAIEDYKHASSGKIPRVTEEGFVRAAKGYIHAARSKLSNSIPNEAQFCSLCEVITGQAISFLSSNETRTEVLGTLHRACFLTLTYKDECITLVDYYVSLVFAYLNSIPSEQLCEMLEFCDAPGPVPVEKRDSPCAFCHEVTDEILARLKDPDTELEIIELLLKTCSRVQSHVQQCKRLVFHYGPLFLARVEKILETKDVCSAIPTCEATGHEAVTGPALRADA